jgi:iron(III) transport system ATP-binding protein
MADIHVEDLSKSFGPVQAVRDLSLTVKEGSLLTLLGPSGCGKSTTLRTIAGLERPDRGTIRLGDRVLVSAEAGLFVPAHRRGMGMVFQSYALWPHMSVLENVLFPLTLRGISRIEAERKAKQTLAQVGLEGLERRLPSQLSGGQQQRVALARSLVYEPSLLLFDEPLSNLDEQLRKEMQQFLRHMHKALGKTSIYVTHNQEEALFLSDEIAVMRDGICLQLGTPDQIYHQPATEWVAQFVGRLNRLNGTLVGERGAHVLVKTEGGELLCRPSPHVTAGSAVVVGFRPEGPRISRVSLEEAPNTLKAKITGVEFFGPFIEVELIVGTSATVTVQTMDAAPAIGESVTLFIPPERIFLFPRQGG